MAVCGCFDEMAGAALRALAARAAGVCDGECGGCDGKPAALFPNLPGERSNAVPPDWRKSCLREISIDGDKADRVLVRQQIARAEAGDIVFLSDHSVWKVGQRIPDGQGKFEIRQVDGKVATMLANGKTDIDGDGPQPRGECILFVECVVSSQFYNPCMRIGRVFVTKNGTLVRVVAYEFADGQVNFIGRTNLNKYRIWAVNGDCLSPDGSGYDFERDGTGADSERVNGLVDQRQKGHMAKVPRKWLFTPVGTPPPAVNDLDNPPPCARCQTPTPQGISACGENGEHLCLSCAGISTSMMPDHMLKTLWADYQKRNQNPNNGP